MLVQSRQGWHCPTERQIHRAERLESTSETAPGRVPAVKATCSTCQRKNQAHCRRFWKRRSRAAQIGRDDSLGRHGAGGADGRDEA
jgi:hypothetical protein